MTGPALCALDDIADGGARAFIAELGTRRAAVFAVRRGTGVSVYENRCPHIGGPLDFPPGRFLSADGAHIVCATHGALFEIADGLCIEGPCQGDHLTALHAEVRDGAIFVREIG